MEQIKSGFDFLFSSYKRAAAVLFIFALLLAIPITVSFISQQQDIRQRAQELFPTISGYPLPSGIMPSQTISGYPSVYPSRTVSGYPLPSANPSGYVLPSGYPLPSGIMPSRTISGYPSVYPSRTISAYPTPQATIIVGQCMLKPKGDANCDGKINTDDFNIWRDEFLLVASSKSSDFNNDGVINTDDFNIWRDGFLSTSPTSPTPISTCPTPPTCQAGQTLIQGNSIPGPGVLCPLYSCTPGPTSYSCQWQGTCNSNSECPSGTSCVDTRPLLNSEPAQKYCVPNGCPLPICLSENTKISTPNGTTSVQDLKKGGKIYSIDSNGKRIVANILEIAKTSVDKDHKVIHVKLQDTRELYVSPGHPTADGIDVATLREGDILDGSRILTFELVNYQYEYTYDLLPESSTGTYYANGILMGSTLGRSN